MRAHEQAHKGAAGSHGGSISYTYQTGPNGKKYAVGGEVPVNISPIKGTLRQRSPKCKPSAELHWLRPIRRRLTVELRRAAQYVVEAQAELMIEKREAPKTLLKKCPARWVKQQTTTSPEPEGNKKPAGESVSNSGPKDASQAVGDPQRTRRLRQRNRPRQTATYRQAAREVRSCSSSKF